MDRSTVTALVKATGGKIIFRDNTQTTYQLPTWDKTIEFREKIPFLTLWGGTGDIADVPPINVYFDQLTD